MKILACLILMFFLSSCSGIRILGGDSVEYSEEFVQQINQIKSLYSRGQIKPAIESLHAMNYQELSLEEQAFKNNLLGVIYFSQSNPKMAITFFELARKTVGRDLSLEAQIFYNLASCYYYLTLYNSSMDSIEKVNYRLLSPSEEKKFHKLKYELAQHFQNYPVVTESLLHYLKDKTTIQQLRGDPLFESLASVINRLSVSELITILDKFTKDPYLSVGYLAYIHADNLVYSGNREEAFAIIDWIESNFSRNNEVFELVNVFKRKNATDSALRSDAIGVILPFTGVKSEYAERALKGIDFAINRLFKAEGKKVSIYFADSHGSGGVGKLRVCALSEKYQVGAIIGGLFSSEAESEYAEAKRRGILYISLSPLLIPTEQKNELLIEVPSSVESEIASVFNENLLEQLGRKSAIFFPDDKRGRLFFDSYWKEAQEKGVDVVDVGSFQKGDQDFRFGVANLLGVNYPREREDELKFFESMYELEKTKGARRIQKLSAVINFDWIYIPVYPTLAGQIIPTFTFYDAHGIKVVGGESWKSPTIQQLSSSGRQIYFVGRKSLGMGSYEKEFVREFKAAPKIIEAESFQSVYILKHLFDNNKFSSRSELDNLMRNTKRIELPEASWGKKEKVWIKEINPYRLTSTSVREVVHSSAPLEN